MFVILVLYVDDVFIFVNFSDIMKKVKFIFTVEFFMTDLGQFIFFLGIQIVISSDKSSIFCY